jgi:hypothetical protein
VRAQDFGEPFPIVLDPLLGQLASAGEDADLALTLLYADASMLQGWPPRIAALTAFHLVGPIVPPRREGKPLHPSYP